MPLINQNENLITIDPPIQWDEIKNGPALSALEMVFANQAPEGALPDPVAAGIRAVSDARIDSYLDRELQKVVGHYAGHAFSGRIEIRYERPQESAAVRVVVRGHYVVRLEAVLGWPPEQVDDTGDSEGHLMEILAEHSVHVADERYIPADETDLPDVLLSWRDAAVNAALAGLGLKDEYGILRYRENELAPNVVPAENAALAVDIRPKGVFGPESRRPGRLMRHKVTNWEEIPNGVTPDDILPGYSARKAAAARGAEC